MKYFLYICALSFFLLSCEKEVPVNDVPEISMVNYGPKEIKEFEDPLYFKINYKDGNGDLGENAPDVYNLILTDKRIGTQYKFRIQELVPNDESVPIKGELEFTIPTVFITDYSLEQNVSYEIFVKDRAGNKSNVINVGPILITK